MTRDEIIQFLIRRAGYDPRAADVVAARLLGSSPEVQEGFRVWRLSGRSPELCIAGFTVDRLIREHSMSPVAALLTLDWLVREPERAAASLAKGHDSVELRAPVGAGEGKPESNSSGDSA